MRIFVETDRLILRELLPQDELGMFELDSDPEVHRFLGNQPVKDMERIREVITFVRQQYVDNGIGRWAMVEKQTNQFIGWTGLKLVKEEFNHHINYYDLGYRLIRKYWGKGYATEGAIASIHYGFDTLRVEEIFATTDALNITSANVLKKAGLNFIESFVDEGSPYYWFSINHPL